MARITMALKIIRSPNYPISYLPYRAKGSPETYGADIFFALPSDSAKFFPLGFIPPLDDTLQAANERVKSLFKSIFDREDHPDLNNLVSFVEGFYLAGHFQ